MQKPQCKLCSERHYTYEPHSLEAYKKIVIRRRGLENVTPTGPFVCTESDVEGVTKSKRGGARAGAGRKAVYASAAARQAAYRGRRGG